ncbi:putative selenate reductase subunit YgfK [Parasporobacterium paucivorans]|uniref:dihydrouracil dehydrogenase (NAD(+)) n=1 Tax=Parasporobacterium paucivorans DSM 15970 TaxID=1122934 RepID=A0A1M6C6A6_9FIRM|nr:putative selenate reductase subunit YgfK [Parasporobacterium paucivorans]SHI56536.1 putative selenate reductase [Parasporobacterium paucivorans DSM 15970]
MGDRMVPVSFDRLMDRILEEYEKLGTVFSVRKQYVSPKDVYYSIFGEKLEGVCGPAAGPHTQLAQNIIAAYCGGARFFELKTVQTLDGKDLPVSKPCIKADEEGYNVEWSTELRVPEAMEEYIKAWYALKLISREFGFGDPDGFVFNMSVGYDLEGIRSDKIDRFIEGLKNAGTSGIWKECSSYARENISRFNHIDEKYLDEMSDRIGISVTLSTLHGCPPEEIERIAVYLIKEKGLNTFVKCNPTLLGYEFARSTLDGMGYGNMIFDDHHFRDDLQYQDAVPMFERLMDLAEKEGLSFGVKLTNTLPVDIRNKELPGEEMYMSGKALYPLTLALADRLTRSFGGKLRISFSGGADFFNIDRIVETGIWPVTMVTNLLKPGGYDRLVQIAESLDQIRRIDAGKNIEFNGIDQGKLHELSVNALTDIHHTQNIKPREPFKSSQSLPITDCFVAPCEGSCPIHQDIPYYINLAGAGRYKESLEIIVNRNPLPFITGSICTHRCMSRCTRNFYEETVQIRKVKLEAAWRGYEEVMDEIRPSGKRNDIKAAIIGGGPAGIAAAHFLAREGALVTIFEKEDCLGGIVSHVVPEFRVSREIVEKDVSFIRRLGVEILTGTEIRGEKDLAGQGFTHIVLAIGADNPVKLDIPGAKPYYAIDFLKKARKNAVELGKDVIVVGGGNTAMDVARAAKRLPGVESVSMVYRRDKRLMPADEEEYLLIREDGISFLERLAPAAYDNGMLKCEKMGLGEPDDSGRRRPVGTGEFVEMRADDIIIAVGEMPDEEYIKQNFGPMAFLAGDCNGKPKTVVEAISDARDVADRILNAPKIEPYKCKLTEKTEKSIHKKKGRMAHSGAGPESERCLQCSYICENCVDVCPNRANVEILTGTGGMPQILHLDDLCNECGNCADFCPFAGRPYKDKLTLFGSRERMEDSGNPGFFVVRETGDVIKNQGLLLSENAVTDSIILAVKERYAYLL